MNKTTKRTIIKDCLKIRKKNLDEIHGEIQIITTKPPPTYTQTHCLNIIE